MRKLLFRGGTVVSGAGCAEMDVLVEGEKIAAVGRDLKTADAKWIDVSGNYLFPGFIDSHTHMDLEVSNTVTIDGFDSGTRAELSGRTTCIVDFATQNRGESLSYALNRWHEKAGGKANCDYAFHLALSDWKEEISQELFQIVNEGVRSFKLYTTYDGMAVDDKTIYEIFSRLKELGAIAGVHCENKGIIDARLSELLKKKGGRKEVFDYPETRPDLAEAEAVSRILKIAACVDTPVVIVHLSSEEGCKEVEWARRRGWQVFVETCPQYLLMDRTYYDLPEGRNYMIAPPLRSKKDQDALWKALAEEKIQTIATDHCSFTQKQKSSGKDDFALTPCGMPGAEERPGLIYHFGVNQGKITLEQMCRFLAENPAKLYGLYPQKGVIAPGSDADLVVWNPQTQWTLSHKTQQSAADYCPMEGTCLKGRAAEVYLRGTLVAKDGVILKEHAGRYVKAGKLIF